MTKQLAANECRLVLRIPSLRAAALLYVVALGIGTFMLLPVPFLDVAAAAGTPALSVAWWLWALMTPWWVSRLRSVARGDAFVALAAQSPAAPQTLIVAQLAAAFAFAGELALLSMPIGAIAYASGRAPALDVLARALTLALFASLSIVLTFHCGIRRPGRIASWILASVLTIGAAVGFERLAAAAGPGVGTAALGAVALVLGALLPVRARRELLYQAA